MEGALKAHVSNWAAEPAGLSDLWFIGPRPTRSCQNSNIKAIQNWFSEYRKNLGKILNFNSSNGNTRNEGESLINL